MSSFGIVIDNAVTDFELGFGQAENTFTTERIGLEAVGLYVSLVAAVVSLASALLVTMPERTLFACVSFFFFLNKTNLTSGLIINAKVKRGVLRKYRVRSYRERA